MASAVTTSALRRAVAEYANGNVKEGDDTLDEIAWGELDEAIEVAALMVQRLRGLRQRRDARLEAANVAA